MKDETLVALQESIAKWERNAVAETISEPTLSWRSCALCVLFYRTSECDGCPVFERTGRMVCGGTPYYEADEAFARWSWHPAGIEFRDAFRAAARAEVDFLKSLLPSDAA